LQQGPWAGLHEEATQDRARIPLGCLWRDAADDPPFGLDLVRRHSACLAMDRCNFCKRCERSGCQRRLGRECPDSLRCREVVQVEIIPRCPCARPERGVPHGDGLGLRDLPIRDE
ncbi:MAG: hypothetical protein EBZ48_16585, partial [Proteobacteria bacterium]|nr:hypothetical protein [Pseudomonadota bacterium]